MTETTLERMARAAYDSAVSQMMDPGIQIGRVPKWENVSAEAKLKYAANLRAALLEARTPSHEITAAVVKPGADRTQAVLDFRAMIDAILAEKA